MNLPKFFAELKRRNVYKVAVAYAVVAWLLIQVATQVFPFFEIPNWAVRLVVLLLILGFPAALILSWAFEITPEGIKRESEVDPNESITTHTGRKLVGITIALAVIAAGLMGYQLTHSRTRSQMEGGAPATPNGQGLAGARPSIPEKSIAVLPFENLSSDQENAFFASGIQDEILTSLAKISGLKVISRTSTAHYQSSPQNLPEIAKQLGVAHVLEGSVQKVADKVHINVQLIRAETDAHVWAQSYDRSLADIFAVEAEVARTVADELRATLSPEEKARVEAKPTQNSEAYVLYLRGKEYADRPSDLLEDEQKAAELFSEAIKLDPNFAGARAQLALVLAHTYLDYLPTETIAARARSESEESLRLQPDLAEALHARAMCLYWIQKDYEGALRELQKAGRLLPNNADIQADIAYIRRRQGRWREALVGLQQALTSDPGNASITHELFRTFCRVRDWTAAAPVAGRAVALAPDSPVIRIHAAQLSFWSAGDTKPLLAVLAALPASFDPDGIATLARWDTSLLRRDFAAAERAVAACMIEKILTPFGVAAPKSYFLGEIALAQGDPARARPSFEEARAGFEAQAAAIPLDPFRHAQLALLYAYLGRKEDALRESRRAVELLPESRDAMDGPTFSGTLALTYARCGEPDKALSLIESLLTVPGAEHSEANISLQDLRLRWQWDPLRNDPRFQKILSGPEPKTVYH